MLTYRYDKWISTSKALEYIINRSQNNNMTVWIIVIVAIVFLGYSLLYPVWEASLIHYLNDGTKKIWKALWKWINDFFVMFEFEALTFSFSFFTYAITLLRMFMLNILDNTFVIILIVIWWAAVLFATILRSYAKFAIVIEWQQVFGAIKRSVYLTFLNFWTTIKFVIIQIFLTVRFLVNAIVIMWVPFLIIYVSIWLDVIESKIVSYVIAVSIILMLILMAYINAIIEAFFVTYWYRVYQTISEETWSKDK